MNKKISNNECDNSFDNNITPKSYLKNFKDRMAIIQKNIKPTSNKKKIKIEDFKIPTVNEYNNIIMYNYNLKQLREICGFYKQRKTGNKDDLNDNLYAYLFLSSKVIKIQANIRKCLVKEYINIHGPSYLINKRKACVNDTDFYSLEDIKDLPYYKFYSYKDDDGIVYGFDISSLYEYIKNQKKNTNPYNRKKFPSKIISDIKKIIRYSRMLDKPLELYIKKDDDLAPEKTFELRVRGIFHKMDELGNYTDEKWFMNLNKLSLIKFIRELHDMWNYRLGLSDDAKRNICPRGSPFRHINLVTIVSITMGVIREQVLKTIELMVSSGTINEYKSLGTIYILTALTLVNQDAANALPWLYQAASVQDVM